MHYASSSTLVKSRFDINQAVEDPAYVAANPTATDRRGLRYVCRRMSDPIDLAAGDIVTVSGQEAFTGRETGQWTIIGNGVRVDGPVVAIATSILRGVPDPVTGELDPSGLNANYVMRKRTTGHAFTWANHHPVKEYTCSQKIGTAMAGAVIFSVVQLEWNLPFRQDGTPNWAGVRYNGNEYVTADSGEMEVLVH